MSMMVILIVKLMSWKTKIKVQASNCLNKLGLIHLSNDNYLEILCNELESLITNNIVLIHAQNHSPNGDSINILSIWLYV